MSEIAKLNPEEFGIEKSKALEITKRFNRFKEWAKSEIDKI